MTSGASTEIEGSLFSFPPACDGLRVPATDDTDNSVGVADTSRMLDALGRFFEVFCALDALDTSTLSVLTAAFFVFASAFSGAGHSTS